MFKKFDKCEKFKKRRKTKNLKINIRRIRKAGKN